MKDNKKEGRCSFCGDQLKGKKRNRKNRNFCSPCAREVIKFKVRSK